MQNTLETRPSLPSVVPIVVTFSVLIIGLVFFLFGLFEYGFWKSRGPGPGFFPVIFGAGTVVLSARELFRRKRQIERLHAKNFLPAIAIALAIVAIPLVGMILSMSAFVPLWLRFIERKGWAMSLTTGIATGTVIYLLFCVWLRVSFPEGMLFDHL